MFQARREADLEPAPNRGKTWRMKKFREPILDEIKLSRWYDNIQRRGKADFGTSQPFSRFSGCCWLQGSGIRTEVT